MQNPLPAKPIDPLIFTDPRMLRVGQILEVEIQNGLIEAGKLIVELSNDFPDIIERLHRLFPRIPMVTFRRVEAVGRERLHKRIAFETSLVAEFIEKLPYDQQVKAVELPIPVVTKAQPESELVIVNKRYDELSEPEVRRVFDKDRIREPKEQAEFLKKKIVLEKNKDMRYTMTEHGIQFKGNPFFKFKDFFDLSESIQRKFVESNVRKLQSSAQMNQINPVGARKNGKG